MDKYSHLIDKSGKCWIWTGSINSKGYGTVWINGKNKSIHRISYEFYKGPIPKELCIDHLCRVRNCLNPDHLEAVTLKENTLRGIGTGALNSKKTVCKRGHPFDEKNTHLRKDGGRLCRKCLVINGRTFISRHGSVWSRMTDDQRQRSSFRVKKWKEQNIPKSVKKSHCINGHSLQNAFIKKNGSRECRECNRIRCKKRYEARGRHELPRI